MISRDFEAIHIIRSLSLHDISASFGLCIDPRFQAIGVVFNPVWLYYSEWDLYLIRNGRLCSFSWTFLLDYSSTVLLLFVSVANFITIDGTGIGLGPWLFSARHWCKWIHWLPCLWHPAGDGVQGPRITTNRKAMARWILRHQIWCWLVWECHCLHFSWTETLGFYIEGVSGVVHVVRDIKWERRHWRSMRVDFEIPFGTCRHQTCHWSRIQTPWLPVS